MTRVLIRMALVLAVSAVSPLSVPAQQGPSFMAGCWSGALGQRTIEEIYTTPTVNVMQGITRYLQDGRTVDYEFTRIDITPTGSQIVPHPKGQAAVAFSQKEASPTRFVWENPIHDFPQRITYSAPTPDSLIARVEGNGRAFEYRMTRTKCPGQ